MAVTHKDLEKARSCKALGSKMGTCILVLCAAMGAVSLTLSLIAEKSRSEVIWKEQNKPKSFECTYIHSAKLTTASASGALLALTLCMIWSQTYIVGALCNPPPREKARPLYAWTSNYSGASTLRWKAAAYFITSWISFAVGSVLLVIGVIVEAAHFADNGDTHLKCLVVRPGLFAVAGVFSLFCTTSSLGFYLIALRSQEIEETEATIREEVLQASYMVSLPFPFTPSPDHQVFVGVAPALDDTVPPLVPTSLKASHSGSH